MSLTIGSLFSGIGGLELGLERAGLGPVKWQVEIDDYATAVLTKHWPDATRYRDVREVGAHNLEPVDLICGGFPCQDISSAGARAGIEGAKSGLWFEYARIVREVRPRYVIIENVAALLFRGMERVLGELAACGYDAGWDCLPASAVGAPHRRDRLFIVAHAAHRRCAPRWPATLGQATEPRPPRSRWWLAEPKLDRVVHGPPDRVDRARVERLGNAVVPQVAEVIGRAIVEHARGAA
jgi:DNA (cytosine-5)-methyltransferase 1